MLRIYMYIYIHKVDSNKWNLERMNGLPMVVFVVFRCTGHAQKYMPYSYIYTSYIPHTLLLFDAKDRETDQIHYNHRQTV